MIYRDYTNESKRLRREQAALDRRFIKEYKYRSLFGQKVMVSFRFHGKIRLERHYFKGLESFCHDIIPVFYFIRKDGSISNARVGYIYSLRYIEEIIPIEDNTNGKDNTTSQGNESSTERICQDQGLAGAAGSKNTGKAC